MTTLVLVTGEQDGGIRKTYERIIKRAGLRPKVVYVQRKCPTFQMKTGHVVLIDTKYISHSVYSKVRSDAQRAGVTAFDARVNPSSLLTIMQDYPPMAALMA